MTVELLLSVTAIALLVGFLVGSVGIGGCPASTGARVHRRAGHPPRHGDEHVQLPLHRRGRNHDLRTETKRRLANGRWLAIGVTPAALLGARSNALLSADVLTTILAVIVIGSGLRALLNAPAGRDHDRVLSAGSLTCIDAAVGFGSALSGTGGPVLLMIRVAPLRAIAASQAPVALSATVGYLIYGEVDVMLGVLCGLIAMVGVVADASLAQWLPATALRRIVADALILAGLMIVVERLTG